VGIAGDSRGRALGWFAATGAKRQRRGNAHPPSLSPSVPSPGDFTLLRRMSRDVLAHLAVAVEADGREVVIHAADEVIALRLGDGEHHGGRTSCRSSAGLRAGGSSLLASDVRGFAAMTASLAGPWRSSDLNN